MKIVFSGTSNFAVPFLDALIQANMQIIAVYTKVDKPAGRGCEITPSPVKIFAEKHKLPVYQPLTLKTQEAEKELSVLQPEILINVAYGLLLPKSILMIPRFGCLNVHPSLLPRWRGAAPLQRALMAGDLETGVSIMEMDEGLDTGRIYQQTSFIIKNSDTTITIMEQAAKIGAKLLLEVLKKIEAGTAQAVPQMGTVTYAKKISKEEGKINWELSASEIDRMIRAFIPWPIAYTEIADKNIRIWQAEPIEKSHDTKPGTIIYIDAHGIEVATGHGVLRLQKIQLPGRKALAVKEIIHAQQKLFTIGTLLK